MVVQTSSEREIASATYPAELKTVGNHSSTTLSTAVSTWLAKPAPGPGNLQATHVQMQALTQNIRHRIDTNEASATVGFQLAAGTISLIPVPNGGISVFPETTGAVLQYQWVR